jgi:hypothetical protein
MSRVDLLTIAERFQIGPSVYLIPDFSVPGGQWKSTSEVVLVVPPNGQQFEATAQFNLSHFNIRDPEASMDKRWRVVVAMPERKKEEFPVGSRILVSPQIRDALLPSQKA